MADVDAALLRIARACGPGSAGVLRSYESERSNAELWTMVAGMVERFPPKESRMAYLRKVIESCRQELGELDTLTAGGPAMVGGTEDNPIAWDVVCDCGHVASYRLPSSLGQDVRLRLFWGLGEGKPQAQCSACREAGQMAEMQTAATA